MSTTKTPREGCKWDEKRLEQFRKLERLLNSVSMLNHGSNFLGHAQECIDLADHLRRWDMDSMDSSFLHFLHEQIIEDRFPGEVTA